MDASPTPPSSPQALPVFDAAARIRIVLVGTQHPGNIGSAARAMKTMGLSRLALVAPERYPDREADALAAGARDVLEAATLHATLAEAIADCRLVLGCTARSRRVPLPDQVPRDAAATALAEAAAGTEVALVFGRERTGLENEELQLCHGAVHIPSDPGYGSLNLAAAVQVVSYELRMAWLGGLGPGVTPAVPAAVRALPVPASVPGTDREPPASHAEMEGLFAQLAETLDDIDFHKGRAPASAMRKLRRLFLRARPDAREVRLLRGVLADAQRMARMAADQGGDG